MQAPPPPSTGSRWLHSFPPKSDDESSNNEPWVTLYAFPHAGGSPQTSFAWLNRLLPHRVRLVAVSLPGRGERLGEAVRGDEWSVPAVARAVAAAIEASCATPGCAFVGHSFGSILAAETARRLYARDAPARPGFVMVSAHAAPGSRDGNQEDFFSGLELDTPENVMKAVRPFGLLGDDDVESLLKSDPEVRSTVLKPLVLDLQLAKNYFQGDNSPLESHIPVVVVGGEQDRWCPPKLLETWTGSRDSAPAIFPGGHFYLLDESVQEQLVDLLRKNIQHRVQRKFAYSHLRGPVDDSPRGWLPAHDIVHFSSEISPDAIAIEDGRILLTYRDLANQTDLLSCSLQHHGAVERGDVVACWLPHSADLILAQLAIHTVGAGMLPLESNYTINLIDGLMKDTECRCLLTTSDKAQLLVQSNVADDVVVLPIDRYKNHQEEENKFGEATHCSWVDKLQQDSSLPPLKKAQVLSDDVAYVTFTSGTTGTPKAVRTSHGGAVSSFLSRMQLIPYETHEREGLNVFFVFECLRPLMSGKTAVVIPDTVVYDPRSLLSFIRKESINRLMINASLLTNILDHLRGKDLSSQMKGLAHVYLEGEVVHTQTAQAWRRILPDVSLWNVYSTWECLDVAMCNLSTIDLSLYDGQAAPVGAPLTNVCTYIVDSQMNIVPHGVVGEVCVSGPGVTLGYSDLSKTKLKFIPNPFQRDNTSVSKTHAKLYKTGDRAVQRGNIIQIKGRMDSSTVKIRAFKVSLQAVELEIMNSSVDTGVSSAAVVPKLDETGQPVALAAYVVFQSNDSDVQDSIQRLHRVLRQTLPEYSVPEYYIPLNSLPIKESSGRKLDKEALPEPSSKFKVSESKESDMDRPHYTSKNRLVHLLLEAFGSVLETDVVSITDNFFHVGGHSLRAASLVSRLSEDYGIYIDVLDLYSHPTVSQITEYIEKKSGKKTAHGIPRSLKRSSPSRLPADIAIIGMEGIFPGASSVDQLWSDILLTGKSAPRWLSKAELQAKGVPANVHENPNWVPVAYAIDDADKFDAFFWGIGAHEAKMMDPQHRVFLEVAWRAVERAGYAPLTGTPERTGVFAACGIDGYLHHNLGGKPLKEMSDPSGIFLAEVGNEKDYISSRVSYSLDLLGPSMTVTSACSSGLSAILQGALSLTSGESDMVLAGASSLTFPNLGYLYEEGLVSSKDGLVRPFDKNATGTVFGDSVGVVVMKRLADAERDGDNILSVIKGWGNSNDGRQKASFSAPSAYGQSIAIEDAIRMSSIDPRTVSYIECHATATNIGDGIEAAGLVQAYERLSSSSTVAKITALGSIKGNIGHANAAAGVTGFIKAVLMLHHKKLCATANLENVSGKISRIVENSPFYVKLGGAEDWTALSPLRAGVSSFGIGGANSHCVLEAYDGAKLKLNFEDSHTPGIGDFHLLTLSAKTAPSLRTTVDQLASHLKCVDKASVTIDQVAQTLSTSREKFRCRFALPASSLSQAADQLQTSVSKPPEDFVTVASENVPSVIMVFPGQGSQYLRMGQDLFDDTKSEVGKKFRSILISCSEIARPILGFDFLDYIYPSSTVEEDDPVDCIEKFNRPSVTQPSLFAVEYALAQILLSMGLKPVSVCGHSLGEYVAATISGIMSFPDAMALIATRAVACEGCGVQGAMLSVAMPDEDARQLIAQTSNVWLSLVNSPRNCVLSGSRTELERISDRLSEKGISSKFLLGSRPYHSAMMNAASTKVVSKASEISTSTPSIPVTSNVTGGWMQNEACQAEYWGLHLCQTVQWAKNVENFLRWKPDLIVEVGPGCVLSTLIKKCLNEGEDSFRPVCLQSMSSSRHPSSHLDTFNLAKLLGDLWVRGQDIDFRGVYLCTKKVQLPPYAFERHSFWMNPGASIYVDASPEECNGPAIHITTAGVKKGLPRDKTTGFSLIPISSASTPNKPSSHCKVYCFPFAGGTSHQFWEWKQSNLASSADIIVVERQFEFGKSSGAIHASDDETNDIAKVAKAVLADAGPDCKIALCGLSAGALVAAEVYRFLPREACDRVVLFTVAGRAPPQPISNQDENKSFSNSSAIDINEYSLASSEIQGSAEWEAYFKPRLLSDLQADTRAFQRLCQQLTDMPESHRLLGSCPLLVCCGTEDPTFALSEAHLWSACTSGSVAVAHFEGSHSFLVNSSTKICDRIWTELLGSTAIKVASSGQSQYPNGDITYEVQWRRLGIFPPNQEATKAPLASHFLELRDKEVNIGHSPVDMPMSGATLAVWLVPTDEQEENSGYEERQSWALVSLMQQMIEMELRETKVILLCPSSLEGSLVAGTSKAAQYEFPDLTCWRIFLPASFYLPQPCEVPQNLTEEVPTWVGVILSVVKSGDTVDSDYRLKMHGRRRVALFVPRMKPLDTAHGLDYGILPLGHRRAQESFIITGGTGGIGKALVKWLIDEQAVNPSHVVLLSRRTFDHPRGVKVVQTDVADSESVLGCDDLRGIRSVGGVFHLAGTLHDGILPSVTPKKMEQVFRPKVNGAMSLLRLIDERDWDPEFFINFSSTSSLLGYPGQSAYCAANSFLDSLPSWGLQQDSGNTPVTTINWGPWAEAGMTANSLKAMEMSVKGGDIPLTNKEAFGVLARVTSGQVEARHIAVCNVQWGKSIWRESPLLAELQLLPTVEDITPWPHHNIQAEETRIDEPAISDTTTHGGIEELLRSLLSGWYPDEYLADLGLDSLDLVRLRGTFQKEFQQSIPLSVFMKPRKLADLLGELNSIISSGN